jgi:hypothetical protein
MCADAARAITEVLLDVRQPVFTAMMDLPETDQSVRA